MHSIETYPEIPITPTFLQCSSRFFFKSVTQIRLLQTRSPYLLCLDEVLNSTEGNVSSLTRFRWHYMRGLQDRLGVGHPLNQHQPRVQELGNLLWGKKSSKQMNTDKFIDKQ